MRSWNLDWEEEAEEEFSAVDDAAEVTGATSNGAPTFDKGVDPEMTFSMGDEDAGGGGGGGGGGGAGGAAVV